MTPEVLEEIKEKDSQLYDNILRCTRELSNARAREDVNYFIARVMRDEYGQPYSQAPYHREFQEIISNYHNSVIWGHVELGKSVDVTSVIPTPDGFKVFGDLRVGDRVFAMDGTATRVTYVSPIQMRKTYRVSFSDGTSQVACSDHQWAAWTADRYAKNKPIQTVTTQEMVDRGLEVGDTSKRKYPAYRWRIPVCEPVQFERRAFTTPPYDLGAQLHTLGHIPEAYKATTIADRVALLRGLMDLGGDVGDDGSNLCELVVTPERLANDALELVRSLGIKATVTRDGDRYRIHFTASDINPFHTPRKADRVVAREKSKELSAKSVVAIEEIEPVPMRCISVAHATHTYIIGREYTVTHNTQQLIGRILWEIGRNPEIRIVVLQATANKALDVVSSIKRYIEESDEYREIFPHIKKGWIWTNTKIAVDTPGIINKDVTVQAAGINGDITSKRFDRAYVDDAVTEENSRSEIMRNGVYLWILRTLMSRLTASSTITIVGNAWHAEDAMHRFAANEHWYSKRFPVRDPVTKESYWPERWPASRILKWEQVRTPTESARSLDCILLPSGSNKFKQEWFDRAMQRGRGMYGPTADFPFTLKPQKGARVFHGVDLGHKKQAGADLTVIFTALLLPDGTRQLINIESGHMDGPEIVQALQLAHARYGGTFFVESVAAQQYILDFLHDADGTIAVYPWGTRGNGAVATNRNHSQFGIASMSVELANDKWTLPCSETGEIHPELSAWNAECLNFDPTAPHHGDRLMASWICSAGIRIHGLSEQFGVTAEVGGGGANTLPVGQGPMPVRDEVAKERWRKQQRRIWQDLRQASIDEAWEPVLALYAEEGRPMPDEVELEEENNAGYYSYRGVQPGQLVEHDDLFEEAA